MTDTQHRIDSTLLNRSVSQYAGLNILFFILAFAVMLTRAFVYTGSMPVVHLFCLACKIALIPIAIILALRTPGKPTMVDIGLLIYGAAMYVSCILNHTQVLTITLMVLDVYIYWALCRWFFVRQSLFPLKATTWILLGFITLNFLLIIWRPEGIWRYETNGKMYYLLGGNYNNMGKAMFIAIVSNMLLLILTPSDHIRQRRMYTLTLVTLIFLSIGTLLFIGSKTSLIGILLILLFGSLLLIPSPALRISGMVAFIAIYFTLQSWAVFSDMRVTSTNTEYFVEHVLGKDMTFTLRTHIWEHSKKLIERQPVIGYGEHDDQWYNDELTGLTTHNLVLHILLKGGWIAMGAFLLLLIITHVCILSNPMPQLRYTLLFSLWTMLFMMIFEVYPVSSWAPLLFYATYLQQQPKDRSLYSSLSASF